MVEPPSLLPTHKLRALLGQGSPFLLHLLALWWAPTLPCFGVPPRSLAACRGHMLLGGGSPPSFPSLTAARVKCAQPFGGLLPLVSTCLLLHARSAHFWFSSPYSVSPLAWSAASLVAPWPFRLAWSPALAGSTAVPGGASKPYLRRASALCSGLAPSVTVAYLGGVPTLLVSAAVLGPPILSLLLPLAPRVSVARVMGGFLSPPRPSLPSPSTILPRVATPGFFPPWGNASTPGVPMPCGE